MTVYADYSYYEREYLNGRAAVVTPEAFPFYARKASVSINAYTYGAFREADEPPEPIKNCCCELAELFYKNETSPTAQGVISEKVGDISVTYENAESTRQALPQDVRFIIVSWLAADGLLTGGGGQLC